MATYSGVYITKRNSGFLWESFHNKVSQSREHKHQGRDVETGSSARIGSSWSLSPWLAEVPSLLSSCVTSLCVCLCLIAPSYKDYKWPHFSLIASFMALFRIAASDRQPVEQPRDLSPDPLSLPWQNYSGMIRKDHSRHSRLLRMVPCRSGFRALR